MSDRAVEKFEDKHHRASQAKAKTRTHSVTDGGRNQDGGRDLTDRGGVMGGGDTDEAEELSRPDDTVGPGSQGGGVVTRS